LYAALEKRDEASHVALARFVAGLSELHATAQESLDVDGDSTLTGKELTAAGYAVGLDTVHVVKVEGCSRSFRLPACVTARAARDFLWRCAEGGILAAVDLERLLKQTRQALLQEPTIRRIPAPKVAGESVVVVGDLHGSISDLAKVIELGGKPGTTTYIFNGDYVDRGRHGVEVLASLCALKLAHPDHIHLNRGNHECKALSRAYGLEKEIKSKYRGPIAMTLFEEMCSLFGALPLAAIVGGDPGDRVSALVVHGGIPSHEALGLQDIEASVGRESAMAQLVCRRKGGKERNPAVEKSEEHVLEDLLWSDPVPGDGSESIVFNNSRKAGCKYAMGAAHAFLVREGLTTLVRSHEVVRSGLERHECGEQTELYTVFSSSHYPDKKGVNEGAALRFVPPDIACEGGVGTESGFSGAEVLRWTTTAEVEPAISVDTSTDKRREKSTVQSLAGLIARHTHAIVEVCERAEAKELADGQRPPSRRRGVLGMDAWSAAMSEWGATAGICLPSADWRSLLPLLVLNAGRSSNAVAEEAAAVDYQQLLADFRIEPEKPCDRQGISQKDIMSLYSHHEELSLIFAWMDADNNGTLSLEEVQRAVGALNDRASKSGQEPVDAEALFRAMDIDGSGALDRHEFMECFRLAGGA